MDDPVHADHQAAVDRCGIGDIALDQFDAERSERQGRAGIAHERSNGVALFERQSTDVRADAAGGSRDENGGHDGSPFAPHRVWSERTLDAAGPAAGRARR